MSSPPYSNERRGLDLLLAYYDEYDVVRVEQNDWWLLVDLREAFVTTDVGTLSFSIWRNTGDVYRVGADHAVVDDPILSLTKEGPNEVVTLDDEFRSWALGQGVDLDSLTTRESRDLVTRWISSTMSDIVIDFRDA